MKYLIPMLCLIAFANCTSKLDKPEHQSLLLSMEENPNLRLSIAAFLENPTNNDYLEKHCNKVKQGSASHFIYAKDSSFLHLRNNIITEVSIESAGDFLNYGIKIGQQRSDFVATFIRLFDNPSNPYTSMKKDKIEIGCCQMGKSVWSFNFDNDILKSITYIESYDK